MPDAVPPAVITVSHLGKRYGATVAVDDVSLTVLQDEIFGLIGPNGPAKPPPWNASTASGNRTAAPSPYWASIRGAMRQRFGNESLPMGVADGRRA